MWFRYGREMKKMGKVGSFEETFVAFAKTLSSLKVWKRFFLTRTCNKCLSGLSGSLQWSFCTFYFCSTPCKQVIIIRKCDVGGVHTCWLQTLLLHRHCYLSPCLNCLWFHILTALAVEPQKIEFLAYAVLEVLHWLLNLDNTWRHLCHNIAIKQWKGVGGALVIRSGIQLICDR